MTGESPEPWFGGPFYGGVLAFCVLIVLSGVIGFVWSQPSGDDGSGPPSRPTGGAAAAAPADVDSERRVTREEARWAVLEQAPQAAVVDAYARGAVELSTVGRKLVMASEEQGQRFDELERVDEALADMFTENVRLIAEMEVRLQTLEAWRDESPWCRPVIEPVGFGSFPGSP